MDWRVVVVVLLLTLVDTFFSITALYTLLRGGGFKLSLKSTFLIATASFAANYATPVKLGIPLRVYLYRNKFGIPVSGGTALMAIEVFLGLFLPVLIAFMGIAAIFTGIGLQEPLIMFAFLMVLLLFTVLIEPRKLHSLTSRLPFRAKTERLVKVVADFRRGIVSIHWSSLLVMSGLLILAYVNVAVRLFFILRSLGAEANLLHLVYAQRIAFVAGSLSMIPMGLGVRDASLTLLLLKMGVPRETSILAAIIERMFSTGWRLLLGLISITILGVKRSDSTSTTQE
jgi:uncharacterized protein (TIRG00374 family)